MGLRSKDIINALAAALGYRVEKRRKPAPDALPQDPFHAQRFITERMGTDHPVILDVGASTGATVATYRGLLPRAAVHCFEPFPQSLATLHERFDNDPNVTIVPLGVGDESGTATFHVNNAPATNSLLPRPTDGTRLYPTAGAPKETITIETTTLDAYADEHAITHAAILKLDIQGGEQRAIRGAHNLLSEQRIDAVYTEVQFAPLYEGAPTLDELWRDLRQLGYTLVDLYNPHHTPGGRATYADALFVSRPAAERVIDTLATHK